MSDDLTMLAACADCGHLATREVFKGEAVHPCEGLDGSCGAREIVRA